MEPLAVVTRQNYIESVHFGLICIVNAYGEIIFHIGDPYTEIYFRSSAKPLQALPLIQSGAAKAFGLSLKEIAAVCASHTGQVMHQDTVLSILNKTGLNEKSLHCGTVKPYNKDERIRLIIEGLKPTPLHCGCSGKHAGMLALAKFRGFSLDDYEKISNPVQQEILNTIAQFTDVNVHEISTGIDGCGSPVYLLPAYHIALAYARLTKYAEENRNENHIACKIIFDAMTKYPEMIAGDKEFCTELIQAANGKLIGKIGSEAVYCLGLRKNHLGVCIKIADGADRALYPVVMQVLKDLDILSAVEFNSLSNWHETAIKNNLGQITGKIQPFFDLSRRVYDHESLGKKL